VRFSAPAFSFYFRLLCFTLYLSDFNYICTAGTCPCPKVMYQHKCSVILNAVKNLCGSLLREFIKHPFERRWILRSKRRRIVLYAAKAAVTFVLRNKSNQKYFLCFPHSASADGLNSARLIGTQICIPITVTAIKINLTLYVLSTAYGHSLGCFFGHIAVSLLRSKS